MEPLALLDGLEIKLRQLSAKADRQRADYERTLAENQQLKRELDRQTGIVNSLKDKLERSQLTTGEGAPAPSADSRQQQETIAYCLREIDRCLDWLQRN
jgi:predicted RNase H-like nuclease (RuvC/YqgF family)